MQKLLFCLFFILPMYGFSQANDEELAAEFLNNQEYDKAAILYEKLLKKNHASPYYYQNLLTCYLELKNYSDAEKMIKRQIREFPKNYFYKVDIGYLLQKQSKTKDAFDHYNELISTLEKNQEAPLQLSTAFVRRDLPDLAISAFLKARVNLNSESVFSENLLDLYLLTRRNKELIGECLEWIKISDDNLEKAKYLPL